MTVSDASRLVIHKSVSSRFLDRYRDCIIYLPPGYDSDQHAHFSVLYLQDGQNLFDPATAFANQDWGLRTILDGLILDYRIEPLIVVGIYNAGEHRIEEYSHVRNRQGTGGRARRYAKFLAKELKPLIDSQYRTKLGAVHTGLGGSSLGGLVSFYIGLHYPELFGKLVIMSPSIWWANRAILRETRKLQGKTDQQIWLDVGTEEGSNPLTFVQDARDLRDVLLARGWKLGYDLRYVEDEGAGHNERAWGCRIRDALRFHFPLRPYQSSPEIDAQAELHC